MGHGTMVDFGEQDVGPHFYGVTSILCNQIFLVEILSPSQQDLCKWIVYNRKEIQHTRNTLH